MSLRLIPRVILLVAALTAGIWLGLHKSQQNSMSEVMVHIPSGIKVSVYPDQGGDGPYNYNSSDPALFTITSPQKLRLKIGNAYDFIVDNSSGQYTSTVSKQSIVYGLDDITIQPRYTDKALAALLPAARQSALSTLYATYSGLQQNYYPVKDQLYLLGDWYAIVLQPSDPLMDKVRIILHKKAASWSVATQPDLSIGQPSNPDIPYDVINAADAL